MAKRRRKGCSRCDMVAAFEKLTLKELRKRVPRADRLGHLLKLLEQAENLETCKCGKNRIAGEGVGALVDGVSRS